MFYTYAHEAVPGLELLRLVNAIVDETEAGGFSAAEGGAEAEEEDAGRVLDLEELGDLRGAVGLGHVGAVGVDDVHDTLPAGQQGVAHELAQADVDDVGHG
jgi:hypothetical protein